ncbi:MAG TPA: pyridoxamine 5'-phosphate oxidase [Thermomicrobiales bacterium]|nr:pyridoxamine 5'-phosphate oxidase [Chloroflexota bacterium]HBY45547.1 pyridoxamine 5'-phosphate oxidase [Chloroflexota bacterium]HCG30434.1 pyridoxamine 5'-phosphate oxidase [Chloroflexota bacterium]HQX62951.1 pyridoxamine 5'-phosphate oxidase [Thermomicrobiales bacterium]
MTDSTKHGLSIADMRREYREPGFDDIDVNPDPFRQFEAWFQDAVDASVIESNAMILATATPDGRPSVRVVLLKGMDEDGFIFFTNYDSRKGAELEANPRAALLFYWPELTRQIRVEGRIEQVSRRESAEYFHSRAHLSQLGAWASRQSSVIPSRTYLEERMATLVEQYDGREVPLPAFWGGYRLTPETFEFWHGRPNRLHDRLQYGRQLDDSWEIERLSP